MKNETQLLLAVFLPIIGAFALPFLGAVSKRARNVVALLLAVAPLALSLSLLSPALQGGVAIAKNLSFGFNFILAADGLAVFMAIASSLVSAIVILYSFGYISHYENQNEYYFLVVMFLGSMLGLIYSANLILLYIFWEMTAIVSWRLIGFFREKTYVIKADKAFLVTGFGALAMLLGFVMLYQQTGSFDLSVIKQSLNVQSVQWVTVLLIMAGIFAKSATLPFHTWLPDAGVAPSPVTALLHAAVLVKIGVYVYARLFGATMDIGVFWHTAVPVICGASALISAGAALRDTDLKRIIAYSTISQIAFIFLGLSLGSAIGFAGGLLYILMHGIAKAGLFLCAGVVEQNTKIKDITKLGGLIKTMPVTAVSFLLCSLSVMGIPPFGGFFSKYLVISGAFSSGNLWIAFTFLAGAVLTVLYLFRVFNLVFLGELKTSPVQEKEPVMVFSVALLAFLSLAAGILIYWPSNVVNAVVTQLAMK